MALLLSACITEPTLPTAPSARLHLQLSPASRGASRSLQQHPPGGRAGRLDENGRQRTLLLNREVIAQINYPDRKAWGGKVILTNLRYHYKLTIQSVVTAP